MTHLRIFCLIWTVIIIGISEGCETNPAADPALTDSKLIIPADTDSTALNHHILRIVSVTGDIRVKDYFTFMDSLISALDSLPGYRPTEHILVHANPWIMDSLVGFDYYLRSARGEFIPDQKEMIVLNRGDSLLIPDSTWAMEISRMLNSAVIDVNIPEFTLRILTNDTVRYALPVRVGKDARKYLKTAGRSVNLRTPIGEGEIVRIEKNPLYINPVDGHRYRATRRDDGRYTALPRIPFLEPTIDGRRQGSLIHPTTNLSTLGKAISNGCVGTGEGDAWRVYYYAPIGTKVIFRYDLEVINESGDSLHLNDIYHLRDK